MAVCPIPFKLAKSENFGEESQNPGETSENLGEVAKTVESLFCPPPLPGTPDSATWPRPRPPVQGRNLGRLCDQRPEPLRFFGVAEDAGRGVDLIHRHMALNLMPPPKFEADDSSVTVTLRLGSVASPLERGWLAQTLTSATAALDRPYSMSDHELAAGLEPSDVQLLLRAVRGQTLTNTVVRNLLGVDASKASRALARLRDGGLLQQRSAGAGATYALNADIQRPDGTRIAGRDFRAEVLGLAAAGSVTNTDIRTATGLDRTAAVRILNRLVADGLLDRHGSRRGTHYKLPPRRWQLSKGDISICLDRTAESHYQASIRVGNLSAEMIAQDARSRMADPGITAVGNTAVMISRCGSASSYQDVDFQWPELATFVKQATLTVTSQEARYHPRN